jgi:hypothetical protein
MLHFKIGNRKLSDRTIHFSLPSGHTCCGAQDCLSSADQQTGKITDGPDTVFRCWAASQEARSPALRKLRWSNLLQLKAIDSSVEQIKRLLYKSLAPIIDNYTENHQQYPYVRHGVGGDFYTHRYFLAWLRLAELFPNVSFYAYTKAIPMWEKYYHDIPDNFVFNASLGGKWDQLVYQKGLKYARVVYSVKEAKAAKLELDHDDSLARVSGPSFALLLHGTQPAGSIASAALQMLKTKHKWNGYGKTHKTSISNLEKACA